ncbi:PAS domain S-box protein [Rufibacter psychrotolerans]|uniref:PAS domain S-box protein n=1 Tax=Rufibacter psychrotolerans TaxID=2812556 RepID=UPI00196780EB|nr:PAS domain S-box protein [Rufibacter sp. SYSU D00308]
MFEKFVQVTETGITIDLDHYYSHEQFHDQWFHQTLVKMGDGFVMNTEDITERKKSEQEILRLKNEIAQKTTDKYQALFNSIDEGLSVLEMIYDDAGKPVDMRCVEVNPAFERITSFKNIAGRLCSELVPTEQYWLDAYDTVIKTGTPLRHENYHAGTSQWFRTHTTRVGGPESRVVANVFEDITERKQRELHQEFLLNFSDTLRTLSGKETIENTSLRLISEFFGLDRSYIATVNKSGNRAVIGAEYNPNGLPSLIGDYRLSDFPKSVRQIEEGTLVIENADTDATLSDLDKASFAAIKLAAVVSCCLRQGERNVIWSFAPASSTPRTWTNDEVKLIEEVTERTWAAIERAKAEEALRKSEEKYRTLFESINQGFCISEAILDSTGKVVDYLQLEVNPAVLQITGLNGQGKLVSELVPNVEPHWLEPYDQVLRTGEPLLTESYNEYTQKWYQASYARIGGPGSRLVGVLFEDTTERKQREREQEYLLKLADALRPLSDAVEIQRTAMRVLGEQLQVDRVLYAEVEDDGKTYCISANYVRGAYPQLLGRFPTSEFGAASKGLRTGEAFAIHNMTSDERLSETVRAAFIAHDVYASIGVPLIKAGRWVANLGIQHGQARQWTEEDIALVKETAERTWAAVERAKAEEAVQASEEKLSKLLSLMPAGVYTCDAEGRITYYNQRAVELWGREPKLGDGQERFCGAFRLWQPDGSPLLHVQTAMADAVEKGISFRNLEVMLEQPNGTRLIANVNIDPLFDGAGKVMGAINVFVDITDSKKTEEALRQSKERLQRAISIPTVGVLFFDLEGTIHDANEAFQHMSGYSYQALTSGSVRWDEITPPEFMEVTLKSRDEYFTTGQNTPYEKQYIRPDGSRWWGLFAGKRLSENEYVEFVLDITAWKETEKRLRETQENLFIAVEAAQLGTWDLDLTNDSSGHRSFRHDKIFGYDAPQEEWGQQIARRHILEEDLPIFDKAFARAQETGHLIFEVRVKWPDGSIHWMACRGRFYFDQNGKPIRGAGVNFDITERKQIEEALQKSEEQFRRAIEDAPIPVIMHAEDGEVLQISHSWTELTGYRQEEVPTFDHWLTQAYGEGADQVRSHMQHLFTGHRRTVDLDFPVRTLRGDLRHWSFSASSPGTLTDGRRFIVGMALDITERRRAEEQLQEFNAQLEQLVAERTQALQESKELLEASANTSPLGMVVVKSIRNASGRIVDFEYVWLNAVGQEMVGEDVVGSRMLEQYPYTKKIGLFAAYVKAVEQNGRVDFEEYFSPRQRWYRWLAAKLDDGLFISVEDITERKKTEKAIGENLALLRQAEEVARMGSWEYEPETGMLRWSEGMYRLFGLPLATPVHPQTYLEYVVEEDRPAAEKMVEGLREGRAPQGDTFKIMIAGNVLILKVKGIALHNDQGQVEKVLGVDLDLSEVHRLEQENLQIRLNQQKALLLAILEAQEEERRRISESLHNGVAQILYATKLNLGRAKEQDQESGREENQPLQTVENLLTEAINETRRVSHELVPMLLQEFGLKVALESMCRKFEDSALFLQYKVEGLEQRLEPYLEIALFRMSQELVNNIVKHSGATAASVSLCRKGNQVLLQAKDNGRGIQNVAANLKGIGLRSIQDRVKLLNGTLSISAPTSGKGTLITIQVPV